MADKRITDLPQLTVADAGDLIPIVDSSSNITKRVPASGIVPDGTVTAVKTAFGGNYSTSEVDTGFTWVDGKPIYKKTINFGALPNTGGKNFAHGISGLSMVIRHETVTHTADSQDFFPVPLASVVGIGSQIQITFTATSIQVQSGTTNRSSHSMYVTLYYVKA